jgi:acetyl esterase/lipase
MVAIIKTNIMKNLIINLRDEFPMLHKDVTLTTYVPDNFPEYSIGKKRRTILLIPGGAYSFVSDREGEVVALRFAGNDFNVFRLTYNVGPYPEVGYPFFEGFAAIVYIRKHAEEYHVDPAHLGVLGFSAGGHFAASLGAFRKDPFYSRFLKVDASLLEINGILLGYPVISMGPITHAETRQNVTLGKPELIEKYSIEKQVTPDFPKTFIWTTYNDDCVDSMNSLVMAVALKKNNVQCELHYYPDGFHGGSVGDSTCYGAMKEGYFEHYGYLADWVNQAIRFINKVM